MKRLLICNCFLLREMFTLSNININWQIIIISFSSVLKRSFQRYIARQSSGCISKIVAGKQAFFSKKSYFLNFGFLLRAEDTNIFKQFVHWFLSTGTEHQATFGRSYFSKFQILFFSLQLIYVCMYVCMYAWAETWRRIWGGPKIFLAAQFQEKFPFSG